ncbi:hypothetical protein BC628DRAFT_1410957 [Trametes gibbosa]|nr:hypothetical protein BC628DRAFT_1410957 [Trametes gibbosa]
MFARSLFVLSVLGSSLALYTPLRPNNGTLLAREDAPTDQDLLASCPGGPGSSNIARADRCTLHNIVNNPPTRVFTILGDPQLNCGGLTTDLTLTVGGETTVSSTTTVSADVGFEVEGLSIGGGVEESTEKSQTISKEISITIQPGRQAVFVAGQNFNSQTGNVQVNYGSPQFQHFIWFTGATVTQLSPIADDVVFDVHESACGTDPRDLNNSS